MTGLYLVPASVCAPERVDSWPVDRTCWKPSRSPPAPGLQDLLNLWGGTTARRSLDSGAHDTEELIKKCHRWHVSININGSIPRKRQDLFQRREWCPLDLECSPCRRPWHPLSAESFLHNQTFLSTGLSSSVSILFLKPTTGNLQERRKKAETHLICVMFLKVCRVKRAGPIFI